MQSNSYYLERELMYVYIYIYVVETSTHISYQILLQTIQFYNKEKNIFLQNQEIIKTNYYLIFVENFTNFEICQYIKI